MTKRNQDVTIQAGEYKKFSVTIKNGSGTAINLTGATPIQYGISQTEGGARILTKTLGSGITITDAANGVLEIVITAADLAGKEGEFHHELSITESSGNKSCAFTGKLTVKPSMND